MTLVPEIKLVAYHYGQKKVRRKEKANHVTFMLREGGLFTISKSLYHIAYETEKLTELWSQLPEKV